MNTFSVDFVVPYEIRSGEGCIPSAQILKEVMNYIHTADDVLHCAVFTSCSGSVAEG